MPMNVLLHIMLGSSMLDGGLFATNSKNCKRKDLGEVIIWIHDAVVVVITEEEMIGDMVVRDIIETIIEVVGMEGEGGIITEEDTEMTVEEDNVGDFNCSGKFLLIRECCERHVKES